MATAASNEGLIADIYDMTQGAERWHGIVERFTERLGAYRANLGVFDPRQGITFTAAPRSDPEQLRVYARDWADANPLWLRTARIAPGRRFTPAEVLEPDLFRRTDFYNQWWRPQRLGLHALATNVVVDGDASGVLSFHKRAGDDDFTDRQVRLFDHLAAHVRRALEIERRCVQSGRIAAMMGEMVDSFDHALALLDQSLAILSANERMHALIEDGTLSVRDGCLDAAALDPILQKAVRSCLRDRTTVQHLQLERRGSAPLRIRLGMARAPVATRHVWSGTARACFFLLVHDPEWREARIRACLAELYGLTPAEIAFALEIAKGDGKAAAAARLGIRYTTARCHLHRIFDKLGIGRQAELVRLMNEI